MIGPDLEPLPPPNKQARREDVKVAAGKIAVFQYAAVLIFLFLITGLDAASPKIRRSTMSRPSATASKQLPIPAPRGKILDRDGRTIVDNHSSYSLILTRENLKVENIFAPSPRG